MQFSPIGNLYRDTGPRTDLTSDFTSHSSRLSLPFEIHTLYSTADVQMPTYLREAITAPQCLMLLPCPKRAATPHAPASHPPLRLVVRQDSFAASGYTTRRQCAAGR